MMSKFINKTNFVIILVILLLCISSLYLVEYTNSQVNPRIDPCVQLEADVSFWKNTLKKAKKQLKKVQDIGWDGYTSGGAGAGATTGFFGGLAVGFFTGPGAVLTSLYGAVSGSTAGAITGYMLYRKDLRNAKDAVKEAEEELEKAEIALEKCRSGEGEFNRNNQDRQTPPLTPNPNGGNSQDPMNGNGGRF